MALVSSSLEMLAIDREEGKGLPLATGNAGQSNIYISFLMEACYVNLPNLPLSEHPRSGFSRLFTIPLEVFSQVSRSGGSRRFLVQRVLQIMSNVQPGGLLALARTCKTLRTMLMSRSATDIWEAAERKTPRLPVRPQGISSPQYAVLAFFNECSLCGKGKDVKLYAKLRVRLCEPCSISELVDVWSIANHTGNPLEAYLSVIFKTPTVPSKHKRETEIEFVDGSPHCLRRDLRTYYVMQMRFSHSRNRTRLDIWEREQHKLAHEHEKASLFGLKFAEMLVRFLCYPKLTPMQVAQLENLRGYPRRDPVNDYKAFNNGDDLKFVKLNANDDPSLTMSTREQCLYMRKALKAIKQVYHPYRGVLRVLGVETNFFLTLAGLASPNLNPFEEYPYPTAATVLSWPLFSDVHDFEPSVILGRLKRDPEETARCIWNWREEGEKELVEWWRSDFESSDHELPNPLVKVKESTSTTEMLSADLRLLLRADTIFSLQKPGRPGFQGPMLHYPHYYKNPTGCPYPQTPSSMNSTRIYRHLEAEGVAKALLSDLNMPDIAYIELLVIGALFACGRCHDCQPKKWQEMVDHYRQEVHLWGKLQIQEPRFKTESSITFYNIHDLNSSSVSKPLAQRLTKQEALDANNSDTSNTGQHAACIFCRNCQLHPTIKGLLQLQSHMKDVHDVTEPVKGLHYTSTGTIKDFGSWGKQWQEDWNEHQAASQTAI
ncbi:hypothetical protein FRC10_004358 [Ceratobasidium sp. 414]|nr:hypothetical protein FRC10_004358 [Ceratobasidium sp. 414]